MEELLERVTYLEQVVSKLAKWTHFSEVVTFDSPAEVVISPERETDCSQNSKIPRRRRRRGGRRSSSSKVSPEVDDSSQLFTIKTEVELEEEMDFADDNDFAIFPKYPDQTGNDDAFPPPSQDEEESHDNTIVDELCDDDSENPQVRSLSPKFVWTPETDLFLLDQISQLKLLSLSGWKLNATWRKICANMSHQFQKEVTQIKVTGRFHLLLDQFNEQEPTPRKKYKPGDEHITAEINEKLEALSKLVQENEQKDQIATSSQQASENIEHCVNCNRKFGRKMRKRIVKGKTTEYLQEQGKIQKSDATPHLCEGCRLKLMFYKRSKPHI
ncbi:uncharacterized protein LOC110854544 isoform X2 [Folsomia candida]|uniref:uncharacterized protein LOC110854544 isoform X2 n=1 Tax=Folsomia candida TaxID=158441 RepID=UPI000B90358F|nr:uncharacterized protein LOC110854544 isoform X2 [Folsomia candida]